MPYLNLKLCAPNAHTAVDQAASALTDITVELLGKKRDVVAIASEILPAGQWHIGGKALAASGGATFFLDIKITDGTNTKDQKAAYIRRVFAAMESILGALDPASYMAIHDMRADAWGYAGLTQEQRYLRGKPL
jgi:4-oxalocrotonate tautomerase